MTNTRVCLKQFDIDDAELLRANQMRLLIQQWSPRIGI